MRHFQELPSIGRAIAKAVGKLGYSRTTDNQSKVIRDSKLTDERNSSAVLPTSPLHLCTVWLACVIRARSEIWPSGALATNLRKNWLVSSPAVTGGNRVLLLADRRSPQTTHSRVLSSTVRSSWSHPSKAASEWNVVVVLSPHPLFWRGQLGQVRS